MLHLIDDRYWIKYPYKAPYELTELTMKLCTLALPNYRPTLRRRLLSLFYRQHVWTTSQSHVHHRHQKLSNLSRTARSEPASTRNSEIRFPIVEPLFESLFTFSKNPASRTSNELTDFTRPNDKLSIGWRFQTIICIGSKISCQQRYYFEISTLGSHLNCCFHELQNLEKYPHYCVPQDPLSYLSEEL